MAAAARAATRRPTGRLPLTKVSRRRSAATAAVVAEKGVLAVAVTAAVAMAAAAQVSGIKL